MRNEIATKELKDHKEPDKRFDPSRFVEVNSVFAEGLHLRQGYGGKSARQVRLRSELRRDKQR